ncbi:hypothetical protein QCA50_019426 [Cerrena zonata]|uniref:Uncharacterized protein n=1 Tax=Cerrena zonata TaxID=2478898 RepID=A0AAW0FDY1_9APHY
MSQQANIDSVCKEYLDLLSGIDEINLSLGPELQLSQQHHPFDIASSPLQNAIHAIMVTSADLSRLRDLKFLHAVIAYSRSRFLIISSPTFARPRSNIGYIFDPNRGQADVYFRDLESEVSAILVYLRQMQPVPEHLRLHARFYAHLVRQVSQLLKDLDTVKEVERNQVKVSLYILTVSTNFLPSRSAINHALHSPLLPLNLARELAFGH